MPRSAGADKQSWSNTLSLVQHARRRSPRNKHLPVPPLSHTLHHLGVYIESTFGLSDIRDRAIIAQSNQVIMPVPQIAPRRQLKTDPVRR